MIRLVLPLLLCLLIAVAAAYVVRQRSAGHRAQAVNRRLADQAVELALSHRELDSDATLASLVMKRAVHVDETLAADLLLLAEEHMSQSPSLGWAITDAAQAARRQLP